MLDVSNAPSNNSPGEKRSSFKKGSKYTASMIVNACAETRNLYSDIRSSNVFSFSFMTYSYWYADFKLFPIYFFKCFNLLKRSFC